MIAHLRGILIEKHPNEVIVECGGVGYALSVPVSTFTALPDLQQEARVHVYTAVREDAIVLYGFVTRDEKSLFERLITVSGIGPKLAVTILSGMAAPDLVVAIRTGDTARLVRIPGVGKKTAERIVLELKEKLQGFEALVPAGLSVPRASLSPVDEDVLSALVNLGCARPAAEAALLKAKSLGEGAGFEALFRKSLDLVR
ncbi:MAG: Holliday junction branch migration protein RuvA [Bryobacterales bacterium]|nr:Holliday junction branch migration protein RuvA [Bryobacterales bacterium]